MFKKRKSSMVFSAGVISVCLSALFLTCSIDTSKLTPGETNGFTSADMDAGQNNSYGIYPHIIDFKIEPTGSGIQPPWIFYVYFDKAMDTSSMPDVNLEEVTGNNQTAGTNYATEVRWLDGKDNILTFKTTTTFKTTGVSDYLLSILSANTKSALGIQMDGNQNPWWGFLDDYIDAPSDFVNLLFWIDLMYPSTVLPNGGFPYTYNYDLWLTGVDSADDGSYLNPTLTDANESGFISFDFGEAMNKADISNSSVEIKDANGNSVNGKWWVDTNGDGTPDTLIESAISTTSGNANSYYYDFFFKPDAIQSGGSLVLGRYTAIVHCNSIHKIAATDTVVGIYQKPYLCNDFDNDGNDNDAIFEFYVSQDGNTPAFANRVWGVYTSGTPGPFGSNEIKTNQAFVVFNTPRTADNLMDESTLVPENLSLVVGGAPEAVTTYTETRYMRCAPVTVWIINAPTDINLNGKGLTISYKVKDLDGNTLDGNQDFLYELNKNDNFVDGSLPYAPNGTTPSPNYITTNSTKVYTQAYNPKGYTIASNQAFVVFDTPAVSDDRMTLSTLATDNIGISGGNTTGSANTEDITNFAVPTTVWQVTFNVNVATRTLTILWNGPGGGDLLDICQNGMRENYTQTNLP